MPSKRIFNSLKDKFASRKDETPEISEERLSRRDRSDLSDASIAKNNPFFSNSVDETPTTSSSRPQPQSSAIPEDAPPAYSRLAPASSSQRRSGSLSRASITSTEDKYAFLSTFDTIFLIDDSSSMVGKSWKEVSKALAAIAPICTSHDPDGIDVFFLNHRSRKEGVEGKADGGYTNIRSDREVQGLFNTVYPRGATPTGTRLHMILNPYMRLLEENKDHMEDIKPINIIVITDGCPTDDPESIILMHARKLDRLEAPPHQVGIQFFQVGNEPSAAEALRHLDDNLSANSRRQPRRKDEFIRDMVDTVSWNSVNTGSDHKLSADGILKVVLGAVIRRLDDKMV